MSTRPKKSDICQNCQDSYEKVRQEGLDCELRDGTYWSRHRWKPYSERELERERRRWERESHEIARQMGLMAAYLSREVSNV